MARPGQGGGAEDLIRRAAELAERVAAAQELERDIRSRRDAAIVAALREGVTTRELGRRLGLTASQVSAVWRRDNPARPRSGGPAGG